MIGENLASKERIVILLRHGESEWNNENRFVRGESHVTLIMMDKIQVLWLGGCWSIRDWRKRSH